MNHQYVIPLNTAKHIDIDQWVDLVDLLHKNPYSKINWFPLWQKDKQLKISIATMNTWTVCLESEWNERIIW